jgi:hypothetical protein
VRQCFSPTKTQQQQATHAQTSCESYFSLALPACTRATAPSTSKKRKNTFTQPENRCNASPQVSTADCHLKTQCWNTLDKKGTTERKQRKSNNSRFTCSPSAVLGTSILLLTLRLSNATLQRSWKWKTKQTHHKKQRQGPELSLSTPNTTPHNANSDLLPCGPFLKNPRPKSPPKTLGASPTAPLRGLVVHYSR